MDNIGRVIQRIARSRANATALVGERVSLSWAELDERTSRLAAALLEHGVQPGDRVGVLARNDFRYWETYFGCAKAGFVVVPVNYRLARAEVGHIAAEVQAAVWIHDASCHGLVPEGVTTVGFGAEHGAHLDYETLLERASGRRDWPDLDPDGAAVIAYTSGTTGHPKGAVLCRSERVLSALYYAAAMRYGPDTRFLSCMPAYVNRGGSGGMASFALGGLTVVMDFEPGAVLTAIERHRISSLILAPAMLRMLLEHDDVHRVDLSSVQQLWTSGAPVDPDQLQRLGRLLPGARIGSSYGMTEATAIALGEYDLSLGTDQLRRRLLSAGRPTALVDVRIADEDGVAVPAGTAGEIQVRGDTVMLGYWRDPHTTDRVLADGWLRTGDVGWLDDEGYLYLVDRRVDVINSGGLNVYSAEVERVLGTHPNVVECAVVGAPHSRWGEAVHAYVVVSGSRPATRELQDWCAHELGRYKRPASVEFVPALPRNALGKVLKHQLRDELWNGQPRRVAG